MEPHRLTIYRASAGSGKTFNLVKEYLRLVLPSPHLYRNILAVTFTNKATQEMKKRILDTLYLLSQSNSGNVSRVQEYFDIQEELAVHQPDPASWVPARAQQILRNILGDYGHFSVSTIESFFQRILRAFAKELDIPLGYEVEMKQDYVLRRLIEEMSLDISQRPDLQQLLSSYLIQQLDDDKGWDVLRELENLGKEIFKEIFVDQVKSHMDAREDVLDDAKKLASKAWARRRSQEAEWQKLAQEALAIMQAHQLQPEDFSRSTIPNFFKRVSMGSFPSDFELNPTTLAAVSDEWKWKAKSKKATHASIDAAMNAGMLSLLIRLVDSIQTNFPAYATDLLISKTAATFGLLGYLENLLKDYRNKHRLLLISDTSRLLTQVIRESDPPFVYEKAGHYYRHFLLDEFQDTSDLQWENFSPLIKESLSQGQFNLLVGDVKQAIYRWRNGNPRLMIAIEKENPALVHSIPLEKNWRTDGGIVNYNNQVFEAVSTLLYGFLHHKHADRESAALLPLLRDAYSDVRQIPQKIKSPGYVSIQFWEQEEGAEEKFLANALRQAHTWIQECVDSGFEFRDIVVLVRNNREGIALAKYLLAHPVQRDEQLVDISVSSADSLLLESHPQVRWLLAALQLGLYPQDALLRATWLDLDHQLAQPRAESMDFLAGLGEPLRIEALLDRLKLQPLYQAVEELLRWLPRPASGMDSLQNAFVLGFVDAVWEYSGKVDTSIPGFMEWWQEERNTRSVKGADTGNSLQIMTIHQSKGLEFPVVMLPFVSWDLGLSARKSPVVWVNTEGTAYEADFPILPVSMTKLTGESQFAEVYQREEIMTCLDNLNLLYVAFTRPQHALFLYAPSDPKADVEAESWEEIDWREGGEESQAREEGVRRKEDWRQINWDKINWKTVGDVLFHLSRKATQQLELREENDRFFLGELALPAGKARSPEKAANTYSLDAWAPPSHATQPAVRHRVSTLAGEPLPDRTGLVEGLILHEALEDILTRADVERVARAMVQRGRWNKDQEALLVNKLRSIVDLEAAKDWFSGEWEIRSEAGILDQDGLEKRPDRVLIRDQQAVVIDFKTGFPRKRHERQVQSYMALLRLLGYQHIQGWLYYTGEGRVMEVMPA